jgi:hypothetical protein
MLPTSLAPVAALLFALAGDRGGVLGEPAV